MQKSPNIIYQAHKIANFYIPKITLRPLHKTQTQSLKIKILKNLTFQSKIIYKNHNHQKNHQYKP
ncbi:hypothetical protein [uncultured Gammaproteobacteria bacterium]|nr:hypothetical protein [uncultured Gammaproteobacteria bacterium]